MNNEYYTTYNSGKNKSQTNYYYNNITEKGK